MANTTTTRPFAALLCIVVHGVSYAVWLALICWLSASAAQRVFTWLYASSSSALPAWSRTLVTATVAVTTFVYLAVTCLGISWLLVIPRRLAQQMHQAAEWLDPGRYEVWFLTCRTKAAQTCSAVWIVLMVLWAVTLICLTGCHIYLEQTKPDLAQVFAAGNGFKAKLDAIPVFIVAAALFVWFLFWNVLTFVAVGAWWMTMVLNACARRFCPDRPLI